MKTKLCRRCKKRKSVSKFSKSRKAKDGFNSPCKACDKKRQGTWYKNNPEIAKERNAKTRKRYRKQVFDHYGNTCACCGESQPLFLSIDHINGGGNLHRKKIGKQFYCWLFLNNFPKNFQTLCMNCNHGKHRNGGICPHKGGQSTRGPGGSIPPQVRSLGPMAAGKI